MHGADEQHDGIGVVPQDSGQMWCDVAVGVADVIGHTRSMREASEAWVAAVVSDLRARDGVFVS